jgi:hypothetical protein
LHFARATTRFARRVVRRRVARVFSSGSQECSSIPGGEELRERLGVVTVGLLLAVGDRLRLARVDDHHLRDMRADNPRDGQRVAC